MEIAAVNGHNNNTIKMPEVSLGVMGSVETNQSTQIQSIDMMQKLAEKKLSDNAKLYYNCGSGQYEQTLKDNVDAFSQFRFIPRVLQDVSYRDLSTSALGDRLDVPFGIAPTALNIYAHKDGEPAVARAAQSVNALVVCSSFSSFSLEDIAQAAPDATKWFQTYIFQPREITLSLVKRAEKAGFKAIVVTVDHPITAKRPYKYKYPVLNNFLPDLYFGNFGMGEDTEPFNPAVTWDDIDWLRSVTALPIVVKGILSGYDAGVAIQHGVSGILVSNHGGRQLDGAISTMDALPGVLEVARDHCEVYVDGGVRHGHDVLKALALGARMVFVGRPAIWGLAAGGEKGVYDVLEILKTELSEGMALLGCASIADISKSMVVRK